MTQQSKKKVPPSPDEALVESAGDADPPTQSELAAWIDAAGDPPARGVHRVRGPSGGPMEARAPQSARYGLGPWRPPW